MPPIMDRRGLLSASLACLPACLPGLAGAQTLRPSGYPEKPVRIIAPFPPGGMVDLLARPVAQFLSTQFGQPFVVENRAGAGGNIGADIVAKAAPDGYTLLVSSMGPLSINQFIYRSMPYDTATAFTPITLLVSTPKVICVAQRTPWRDLQALIRAARQDPDVITAGSAGSGSSLHLALELFKEASGVRIQHVPYRGVAPALTDLISGTIDMAIDNLPTSLNHIRSGSYRALAVATPQRLPQLPDVPTTAEAGLPGFVFGTSFGLAGPGGLPPAIVAALAEAVARALRDPGIGPRLVEQGAILGGQGPEAFATMIQSETLRLEPMIRRVGIRAE
jgi:tripartite-type tricarboxylate transporter receptor subunit TctC